MHASDTSLPVVLYPGLQAHVAAAPALVLLAGHGVHDGEPATLNELAAHAV